MKNQITILNHKCWPAAVFLPIATLLIALGLAGRAEAQSYALTNGWTGVATTTANRDIAYSAVSNEVFLASTAPGIGVYDGSSGTSIGVVSFAGIATGGAQTLNQIGVADDGAIYGANLGNPVTSSSFYRIYRWSSWNAAGSLAYAGDPLLSGSPIADSQRIGDSFAITGSGTNTLMLAGIATKSAFVIFSTIDGINFTNTVINVPTGFTAISGEFGLAFYTNNTFIAKPANSTTVYLIQYPTNLYGQSSVIGTVLATTTLATPATTSAAGLFSFSPDKSLLGVGFMGSSGSSQKYYGSLYSINFATGVTLLASTNVTAASNGNLTGGVALGGAGKTNFLYVLNSANTLQAFSILSIPPLPPSIATQPAGGSVYPPYTLSVSALGSSLGYQWQATNALVAGSFTNIPGAISNNYTISILSTNYYRVIVSNFVGSVTSSVALVTTLKAVTNSAVSSLWQVAAGQSGYTYLTSASDNTRGLAYDTNSQRVVVASTSGLFVLNGNSGANIEQLSLTGVSFGGLLSGADQVGIADDGAVYAGNVVNAPTSFALYRWSVPSNIVTATVAFNGDPGNGNANADRWGDTMAVRGSGAGTQILLASRVNTTGGGTNVALLTPNDGAGLTYQSTVIAVSGVPANFAINGLSFGAGNTFWAKTYAGDLYEIAFDTNALTGTVIFDYSAGNQIPGKDIGVGVDAVHGILASINLGDIPNDLQLSQLTGTSDSPVLFNQSFFASANVNGNDNAVITVKYPRVYALNVDNGLVAVTYGVPATTAPTIGTPPASTTAYTNVPSVSFSVGASGSLPLYYQWRFNSNSILGATSSVYTVTSPTLNKAGSYDVVVHNISGSITSSPAILTLIVPVLNPHVTHLWSIGPGTNGSYLTTSGYETRGLAYDPISGNLFVADHSAIHVYNGTNGAYLFDISTAGLPTGGINGWTVDQVGVADDGTLYSCNLSPDGSAFSIAGYTPPGYGPFPAYGGNSGGNDLLTLDPGSDRWGDTMAVRGSGLNAQILLGSYNGTNVAVFTTQDATTFSPIVVPVLGGVPLGFAGTGITFGPGNTFYAKGGHNYNLRQVLVDTNVFTGTVMQTYLAPTQIPNDLAGIAVDVTNNILGGVCLNDTPNDLQLYLLSGNTNSPYLFDQDFFPANNANAQDSAQVTLKNGLGFALDVNNGIVAFSYSMPSAPAVKLTSVSYLPGNVTLNWNNTFVGHGYQVVYKTNLLDAAWIPLGSPVTTTNASASYTDASASGATRFYRIISQ